jgi:hypothetical protein
VFSFRHLLVELNVDEVRLRPIRLPVGFGIVVPAHAPAAGAAVRGTAAADARVSIWMRSPQLLHSIARLGGAQGPYGISTDFALVLVLDFVRLAPIEHDFARHLGHPRDSCKAQLDWQLRDIAVCTNFGAGHHYYYYFSGAGRLAVEQVASA